MKELRDLLFLVKAYVVGAAFGVVVSLGAIIALALIEPPPANALVAFRDALVTDQLAVNGSAGADVTYVVPDNVVSLSIKGIGGFAWRLGDDSSDITANRYVPFSGTEAWNGDPAALGGKTLYLRGDTASSGSVAILLVTRP